MDPESSSERNRCRVMYWFVAIVTAAKFMKSAEYQHALQMLGARINVGHENPADITDAISAAFRLTSQYLLRGIWNQGLPSIPRIAVLQFSHPTTGA